MKTATLILLATSTAFAATSVYLTQRVRTAVASHRRSRPNAPNWPHA